MEIALIGRGAIASYVSAALERTAHVHRATLVRPEKAAPDQGLFAAVRDLPDGIDLVVDCAGHEALRAFGPDILASGRDIVTVSIGALADPAFAEVLERAAKQGHARLHLASGAIGALDCLQAARAGGLAQVTYTGRKPPAGWRGSPAEETLDLVALTKGAQTHFEGSARAAALRFPKNANVAAAVALAGLGFDATQVRLIADAEITSNIHEVSASGDFGSFSFRIDGNTLPGTPHSSALAAMSVVAKITQLSAPITL